MLSQVIRRLGARAVFSLTLLLMTFVAVVVGLTELTPGLNSLALAATTATAILLVWLLAQTPLPGWLVGIITLILGLELILVRVGRLGRNLLTLLEELARLAGDAWNWPRDGPPDGAAALHLLEEIGNKAGLLLAQLWEWSSALLGGESPYDLVAAALAWNLMLWAMAAWAAWAIGRRRRPLLGIAPAGALLATALAYSRDDPLILVVLLAAALPLLALTSYGAAQNRWQNLKIGWPDDIGFDVTLVVIGLTIILLTASMLAPSISIRQVARFARRLLLEPTQQTERIADSLGLDRYPGGEDDLKQIREPGLPRRHLIGSGPELSEQVVLVIDTGPEGADPPPPHYWRGVTYDQYTGLGWFSGETETVAYRGDAPAGQIPELPAQVVLQEVRFQEGSDGLLYAAGTLLRADPGYRVIWRVPPGPGTPVADGGGDVFASALDGDVYRAESWVPAVTKADLRAAGDDYPSWVRDRHLSLPPDLPDRVGALSRELTAASPTPYDRAEAIESYLRTLTYTLDLPAPPVDQDVVDYFLFDLQRGYCDYFATAMVVMARAAGVPARLAVGYAPGYYDPTTGRTIVTAADAHSWAEVYFPDFGWVQFEPTANRPAFDRLPPKIPGIPPGVKEENALPDGLREATRYWWLGLLLPMLLAALWFVADGWWLRQLSPTTAGATLYQQLYKYGLRLEVPAQAGDTPYEFASSLAERLRDTAQGRRWSKFMTPATQEVDALVRLYVHLSYSPHQLGPTEQAKAVRTWRRLRWRLWLAWLWRITPRAASEA